MDNRQQTILDQQQRLGEEEQQRVREQVAH